MARADAFLLSKAVTRGPDEEILKSSAQGDDGSRGGLLEALSGPQRGVKGDLYRLKLSAKPQLLGHV